MDYRSTNYANLEDVRIFLSVPYLNEINTSFSVPIDGMNFVIRVLEEYPREENCPNYNVSGQSSDNELDYSEDLMTLQQGPANA